MHEGSVGGERVGMDGCGGDARSVMGSMVWVYGVRNTWGLGCVCASPVYVASPPVYARSLLYDLGVCVVCELLGRIVPCSVGVTCAHGYVYILYRSRRPRYPSATVYGAVL